MHIVVGNLKKRYLVKGKNYPTKNRDRFSIIVQKLQPSSNESRGILYCKGSFDAMFHKLNKNN